MLPIGILSDHSELESYRLKNGKIGLYKTRPRSMKRKRIRMFKEFEGLMKYVKEKFPDINIDDVSRQGYILYNGKTRALKEE